MQLITAIVVVLAAHYPTSSVAQQAGASKSAWRLCHGADGTQGAPIAQKIAGCEEIIRHRGELAFGYSGALDFYPKITLQEKKVSQLLLAHKSRMLQLIRADRNEDALDDCNEIQRLLPHAADVVRTPFSIFHGFREEGWTMRIVLLKKLGRLGDALRAVEELRQLDDDNDKSGFELKGDIEALQANYAAAKVSYSTYLEEIARPQIERYERLLRDSSVGAKVQKSWREDLRSWQTNEVSVQAKIAQMDRNLQSRPPTQAPLPEKVAPRPEPIKGPGTEGCRLFPSLC